MESGAVTRTGAHPASTMTTTLATMETRADNYSWTFPSSSSSSSSSPPSCNIDESYKYIFLPICYSFTCVFSLSLNAVVLYRAGRHTKRWNASLIYMVNLAATDFMYGLSLPFLVASYVMRNRWVFGDPMCRLVRFLFYFNLYGSIFFLTCISVHRYLGICHPMRTITLESKRAVRGACALVWAVVFALTCPIFRFAQTGGLQRGGGGGKEEVAAGYLNCWDDAIDKELAVYVPYAVMLHILGFFLPFSVIAWCYSRVVLTIVRSLRAPPLPPAGRGGAASRALSAMAMAPQSPCFRKRRKSVKTIVTITLLFALCFLPFHVTRTLFLLLKLSPGLSCSSMRLVSICYKVTRPLASFNAWLNALLYFLTKDKAPAHCPPPLRLPWPLRLIRRPRGGAGGPGGEESKSSGNVFHSLP